MGVTYNYGAGPTYTKIASQTLGSAAASVTFSNLPQNYTDLVIIMQHKVSGSATAADGFIRVNSDTGSNYSNTQLASDPGSSRQTGVSFWMWGADASTEFAFTRFDLMNYSNNTTYKSILWRQGLSNVVFANVGLWRSTAAITSLSFTSSDQLGQGVADNFASGSTFTLYGVAAALKPKATGGTVTFDPAASKWVHTFTSSGVFTPTQGLTVDYLVVAGGGGGGRLGGGGGAGGMRCTVTGTGGSGSLESALNLTTNSSYTVTVGAGGAGSSSRASRGTSGVDSVFSTITSAGGGGGGSGTLTGSNGGSGGGGAENAAGGSASPSGQGFAGGTSADGGSLSGGGGASAVGGNGSGGVGGAGGNGRATSITGASVTYGGGGGGGGETVSTAGGTGGGGGGATSTANGTAGTANTGGGGGGARDFGAGGGNGAAGGSGIVIVRYSA